jgi:Fe-S oxidoreductase
MATYKAEFLAHHYAGRVRPRSHYSMGWLPLVARLASHAPRAANFATHARGLAGPAKFVAGVDHRRALPVFAATSFQRAARRPDSAVAPTRGEVVLWPDTFTNFFDPHIADAALAVLEGAGWRVQVPTGPVCCGLTWISTGQLRTAKRVLHHAVRVLRDHLRAGGMVVGLEPSCTAVFRADAAELLPDDEDVGRLRRQTVTLAELLNDHTPGWQPPALTRRVVVQTHCHQHAVLGRDADLAVLADAGADVELLEASCCGLAGNFGFERGHYDVSMACAERVLLPAVRRADADTVLLADGFSCRTQIRQATGDRARHLAELLTGEGGAVTRVRPGPAPPKP